MKRKMLVLVGLSVFVEAYCQAALIEDFTRIGGEAGWPEPFLRPGWLNDGAQAFCDRSYVYSDVPSFLIGADYIVTENNDKYDHTPDVEYEVNIVPNAGVVYAFVWLDNRWVTQDLWGDNPPYFPGWPAWLAQEGWTDADFDLGILEVGGSGYTRYSSIFYKPVISGNEGASFHVGAAELPPTYWGSVCCNFYGIAVSSQIPEPSTLLLLSLGGLYVRVKRRRR